MEIKNGGQLDSLHKEGINKLEKIEIFHERGRSLNLMINGSSLSYLSIEEALDLKTEIESALLEIIKNPN